MNVKQTRYTIMQIKKYEEEEKKLEKRLKKDTGYILGGIVLVYIGLGMQPELITDSNLKEFIEGVKIFMEMGGTSAIVYSLLSAIKYKIEQVGLGISRRQLENSIELDNLASEEEKGRSI